jgi:hypothetical protein
MNFIKKNWFVILGIIAVLIIVKSCEPKPIIKVKTEVNIKDIIDSVRTATLKGFKPVYIDTSKSDIRYIKGKTIFKDSIVYVKTPNSNTIEAKQYDTELFANNATAKLQIIALGEVIDVRGAITYPEKETTTKVTKIVPMSGLFVYGGASVSPMLQVVEIGLDYQIRNTIIIGASINHDLQFDATYVGLKLGIRVF